MWYVSLIYSLDNLNTICWCVENLINVRFFHCFLGVLLRRLYRPEMVVLVALWWFSQVRCSAGATSLSSHPRDRLRWTCQSSSPIESALRLRPSSCNNSGGKSLSSHCACPSQRRRCTKNNSSPTVVDFALMFMCCICYGICCTFNFLQMRLIYLPSAFLGIRIYGAANRENCDAVMWREPFSWLVGGMVSKYQSMDQVDQSMTFN